MDKLTEARNKINRIDQKMAELFEERMKAAEDIAEYKLSNGLAIYDATREAEVLENAASNIQTEEYKEYYKCFLQCTMDISKSYQHTLIDGKVLHGENVYKQLIVDLKERSYPITIGRDLLKNADKYFNLNRSVVIVTDSGVPAEYSKIIASLCKKSTIITVSEGEGSKSIATLNELLESMCSVGLERSDCIVAVGGGVVGDLTGLAASMYMRGIDFYNVPTTLLSQVDSSVGGKTAINFAGIKNLVGAFYQPKAVLIDVETCSTLPSRQLANGICEAVKMSVTCDENLFGLFEALSKDEIYSRLEEIVTRSIIIKKKIVEKDEKESGLRMVLNFGHTLAHGIEALEEMTGLYHGECVALGMLPMSAKTVRDRLTAVLEKLDLPTHYSGDITLAARYALHDKKCRDNKISIVVSDKIGHFSIESVTIDEFTNKVNKCDF